MEDVSSIIAARRCLGAIIAKFDYASRELDSRKLKEFKRIVRDNASIVPELVQLILQFLRRENSDCRLAVVLICDQLYQRSHAFRIELTNSLQDWLVYTAETDPLHFPLPLPKEAANHLKVETLKIVKAWHEKFSVAYPKLSNAYSFLRSSKAFDFERANAQLTAERVREEEAEKRKEQKAQLVIESVKTEFSEREEEFTRCLDETRSAIELLFPKFAFEDEKEPCSSKTAASRDALHAYVNTDTISLVVPIEPPTIKINDSNEPVVTSLLDSYKMLCFYNKLISKWLAKLAKFGGPSGAELLKQTLDFKAKITAELQRCEELKLSRLLKKKNQNSDSDSDDFEDVPDKEGLELDFKPPDDILAPHEIERIRQLESGEVAGPSAAKSNYSIDYNLSPHKSDVPILPFGLDLQYWGQKKIEPAEIPRNNSDCHRFWRPSDEGDTAVCDGMEVYTTRLITFSGKEDSTNRQCRAPLADGSLCSRRDKFRCPVHGPIIDRDNMGFPREELKEPKKKGISSNSGDVEFVRDIETAVGVTLQEESLGSSKTRKRRRKILKKRGVSSSEEVRKRLSAKLLNPRSIKRVSQTLDAMQKARASKNFEHQFNYALSRT